MAQITIYLPDDVANAVKSSARRAKKSVSAYLVSLATHESKAHRGRWPKSFVGTFGGWEGRLPRIDDPPPEPVPRW